MDIRSKVTCEMYGSKMNQVCHTFDSWALAVVESQKIRSRLAEGGGGLPGRISFRYDALENLRMLGMWRDNVARTKAIRLSRTIKPSTLCLSVIIAFCSQC